MHFFVDNGEKATYNELVRVEQKGHSMNTTSQKRDDAVPQRNGFQDDTIFHSRGERTLPYLLALMETCWVDTILIAIAGTTSSYTLWLPLWVPFVVIAGSCWLAKSFSQISTSTDNEASSSKMSFSGTLLVVLLIVGATLFSLWNGLYASTLAFYDPTWLANLLSDVFLLGNGAFRVGVIIALILYFYWRGLRLARTTIEPGNVFFGIRLGIGVMLAVIVYRAATNTTSSDEALLLLLIPLFLVAALLAHAFAQTTFVRTLHSTGLQGSVSLQERALFLISIAFGVVLLLASLVVGAFASPDFLAGLQGVFAPVVIAYNWLTTAIAFAMTLLIAPFVLFLQLFHLKFQPPKIKTNQTTPLTRYCLEHPHASQCVVPPGGPNELLLTLIKIILPIVLVIVVVLLVVLLRRMRRARIAHKTDEVHESLWSWELFLTQLRAFLHALWLRLFPRRPVVALEQGIVDERAFEPTARTIREMYRALLRWAADRGYPRKKDETPYEFRQRLHSRLPLTEPELGVMTDAYTAIRYGRSVPSDADVAHVQQTWSQLRQKQMDKNNLP